MLTDRLGKATTFQLAFVELSLQIKTWVYPFEYFNSTIHTMQK